MAISSPTMTAHAGEASTASAGGRRRWRRRALVLLAAAVTLPLLLHGYGSLLGLLVWPLVERQHLSATAPLVQDRDGRTLGIVPAFALLGRDPGTVVGVVPDRVPPLWAELVVACEDRRLRGYLGLGGIDPVALARALAAAVRGERQGGSTIAIQLVRLLYGTRDPSRAPVWRRLASKPLELALAPVLRAKLGPDGLLAWYATHATLAKGLGNDVAGLSAAAEMVFGRALGDLGEAEVALLAGATKEPAGLTPRGAGSELRADWETLKRRARRCLESARPTADGRLRRAISALPYPHIDEARLRHPQRRLASLSGGTFLTEAMVGLREAGVTEPPNRLVAALRRDEQADCERAVRGAVQAFAHRHAERLAPRGPGRSELPGELLVAVADEHGGVRCLVGAGAQGPRLLGPPVAWAKGRYDPGREPFILGSLGKLVLALAVARVDGADALWCNAAAAGPGRPLRNAGGGTGFLSCDSRAAWVSAREVFSRSLSLPVLWRARRLDQRRLAALVGELGLSLAPGADVAYALAFGLVRGRPKTMLELVDALAACALGRKLSGRVHLLLAPGHGGGRGSVAGAVQRRCTTRAARFLRAILAAPLAPGGTLAATRLRPGDGDVQAHPGKTGTVEDADGRTLAVLLAGSVARAGGSRLTYFVRQQTPDPARPLGHGLGGRDLVPLAEAALSTIRSRDPK
jgi:hypothetical protein